MSAESVTASAETERESRTDDRLMARYRHGKKLRAARASADLAV